MEITKRRSIDMTRGDLIEKMDWAHAKCSLMALEHELADDCACESCTAVREIVASLLEKQTPEGSASGVATSSVLEELTGEVDSTATQVR